MSKNWEQILQASFDSTTGSLRNSDAFFTELGQLGSQSVAKDDSWTSNSINLSNQKIKEIVVTARATYGNGALAGCSVQIFTSIDGANYDTDAYGVFGPDFNSGSTKQKTRKLDVSGINDMKIGIINSDTTFAVSVNIDYRIIG